MTRKEHLLTILSEECVEVLKRASKALRFGILEVQSGKKLNNAERIAYEMADLVAVYNMLVDEKIVPVPTGLQMSEKREKVEKHLNLSGLLATLNKN